jgi:hypothetical protein
MKFRAALITVAVACMFAMPNAAQAGGHGHGYGRGHGKGFPGVRTKSFRHGNATSRAARDRSTRGVAHAMGVVRTTPAARHSHALSALQDALDRMTLRGSSSSD